MSEVDIEEMLKALECCTCLAGILSPYGNRCKGAAGAVLFPTGQGALEDVAAVFCAAHLRLWQSQGTWQ